MKKLKKNFLIWLIIAFILSSFYNFFTRSNESRIVQKIAFSDFLKEVEKDNVLEVNIKGDLINGNLVDGTGKKASKADIGIIADKIDQIGNLKDASAKKIIDANGKTLSPGFIDTHAHSDAALLIDPIHENGIRQGITTEILGQDGLSYAPLSKENYLLNKRYLAGILQLLTNSKAL